MTTEILIKAENLKTGMTYWDGTMITVESSTTHFVTLNFSNNDGLSVSRKVRKSSEIRVIEDAPAKEIKVFVKSSGYGSDRYGNCECCGKHSTEMFHTTVLMEYLDPDIDDIALTGYKMPCGKWGHLDCLNTFAASVIASIGRGQGQIIYQDA